MTYLLDTNAISELMKADPRIETWMAGLDEQDRIVTCTIVRGEILFGISRLSAGSRRAELEQAGHRFLDSCASPCRRERAISTQPSSAIVRVRDWRWMKMISGLRLLPLLWERRW